MSEIDERIHTAIIKAIREVHTNGLNDVVRKTEYIMNMNKILDNYEELRPIFNKYFKEYKENEL